jgi:predicted lysophospholipase L1 biosynthesis ABC-type transport system permease subunit
VAVVSETAARLYWGHEDPIGRHFELGTRMGQGSERAGGTVVGVVRDVRSLGPATSPGPAVYLAHAQVPVDFMSVAIKTAGHPSSSVELARTLVRGLDPDVPMYRVRSLDQLVSEAVAQPRLYAWLLAAFAGAAILLAALGIYGVLTHSVSQRTREIGIRLALGARRSEVIGMVVRQAGGLALVGLLVGLALAMGVARLLRTLLFGIEPTDLATYGIVFLALVATAAAASWLPASRAARIEPTRALRYE